MKGILKKMVSVNLWSLEIHVKEIVNLIVNEGSNGTLTVQLTSQHVFSSIMTTNSRKLTFLVLIFLLFVWYLK